MNNNFSTLQSWHDLDLSALKKCGSDEWHGPCPVTGEGKDRFWVKPTAQLIGCRDCAPDGLSGTQFTEHLTSIGWSRGVSVSQTFDWTNYPTGETVTQTRAPTGDPKYLWPKGTKTDDLVYLARHNPEADRPLVFCEGAKAANAVASKLPADYDVIGFVSSTRIPSVATLTALARGRACVVWPDDDLPGAQVATRLVSALARSASDVRTVVPARLGLTGGHGHDAEQWRPADTKPKGEFEAACGTAQPAPVEHFRSIWTYTREANPDVLIPGLAWRGRVSKISAAPKLGKTSLLANGIAAWQAGRAFLGEAAGPPGSVLYVSETPLGLLRSWLERYGCPSDAPILAGDSAGVDAIAEAAREHQPDLVIIDSLTDLHAASDGGNLWNAGDVRKLIQPLRALGCAVVLVHHVRKSDGAARDSGDLEAAPDMNIAFDPGYSFGADDPPPGPRRLRYFGRWTEPTRALTFTEADGYALANSTRGEGPEGGGGDPFTVGEPVDPIDSQIKGFLMEYPEGVSQKAVRKAIRGARVARLVARLKVVGTLGPDKLWRCACTTPSPPPEQAVPDSQNPPIGNSGTGGAVPAVPVNGNLGGTGTGTGTGTGSHPIGEPPTGTGSGNRLREPLAGTKNTTPPPPTGGSGPRVQSPDKSVPPRDEIPNTTVRAGTLLGGDNDAKGGDVVKHDRGCPKCFGKGIDAFGKPCDYVKPIGSGEHTEGIKRWDDATATWVDAVWPDDCGKQTGKLGNVHLRPGWTVCDGDQRIHIPLRWNETEEAWEQAWRG